MFLNSPMRLAIADPDPSTLMGVCCPCFLRVDAMANINHPTNKSLSPGSYVEIIGGKYVGYFASVLGFTATGQCRIKIDHARNCRPGTVPTKNLTSRCLRRHVEVPEDTTGTFLVPAVDGNGSYSELDLLARVVALQLKEADDSKSSELLLESFVATVRSLLL